MYWKVSTEILNCIMGQLSVIIVRKCLQQFKEDTFKVSITNSFLYLLIQMNYCATRNERYSTSTLVYKKNTRKKNSSFW